jgi:hypothetical protein
MGSEAILAASGETRRGSSPSSSGLLSGGATTDPALRRVHLPSITVAVGKRQHFRAGGVLREDLPHLGQGVSETPPGRAGRSCTPQHSRRSRHRFRPRTAGRRLEERAGQRFGQFASNVVQFKLPRDTFQFMEDEDFVSLVREWARILNSDGH